MKDKKAFTLAEVLITLGIIGVVAALIIPGIVRGYQKIVVENKVKKFYTTMALAIKSAEAEHGDFENWIDYPGEQNNHPERYKVFDYIKPYLKLSDIAPLYSVDYVWFRLADGTCAQYRVNGSNMIPGIAPYKVFFAIYTDCGTKNFTQGKNHFEFSLLNFKYPQKDCVNGGGYLDFTTYWKCRDEEEYGWKAYECAMILMSNNFKLDNNWNTKDVKIIPTIYRQKGWY